MPGENNAQLAAALIVAMHVEPAIGPSVDPLTCPPTQLLSPRVEKQI